jgi:uncharacterized membrane protein
MISFMLLTNFRVAQLNQFQFNDSILALYAVLCLFLIQRNRPLLAACALTLGLSIKAGAMLLMPAFFGWVQYQHGMVTLLKSILIVVCF